MNQYQLPYSFRAIQPSMCPYFQYYMKNQLVRPICFTMSAVDLSKQLRMLWEQHIAWTRFTIMAIVYGLPDVDVYTARLLKNPKDFKAALAPLYGDAIASRFDSLLTEHLVIAAQLVKAAKAGNSAAAAEAEKRWYANGDQIAAFLAEINPYWSRVEWTGMFHDHLAMTKAEAVDMLTGKYRNSAADYDEIVKTALQMADVMTEGILRQFPGKFS